MLRCFLLCVSPTFYTQIIFTLFTSLKQLQFFFTARKITYPWTHLTFKTIGTCFENVSTWTPNYKLNTVLIIASYVEPASGSELRSLARCGAAMRHLMSLSLIILFNDLWTQAFFFFARDFIRLYTPAVGSSEVVQKYEKFIN